MLPGNEGLCVPKQPLASKTGVGTFSLWQHVCADAAADVISGVNNSSSSPDAAFLAAAPRKEGFNSTFSCTDMAAVLPTCGGALRRHWLPLLAAMVAAGGAAAAVMIIGWGRLVSRSSHAHRYRQAGATDNLTTCAGELEAGEAETAGAGGAGGEVELGSWRLQSTSLRLRLQDFEFLRSADGQPVRLGQGATAKASQACCIVPC